MVTLIKVATKKKVQDKMYLWVWSAMTMCQRKSEKKNPPSSFDFVCLFFKTNHRSNQLEAKKFQSRLSRPWSFCCYHPPASIWENRRSWWESARVWHLTHEQRNSPPMYVDTMTNYPRFYTLGCCPNYREEGMWTRQRVLQLRLYSCKHKEDR